MRNINLEASIWHLFTSAEFFEAAARESEETMEWFGNLTISRQVANFGRNNQIFDKFKILAIDFRRGAELARLGDYQLIWKVARSVRGDVRGMLEQPLHSWMTEAQYNEFEKIRLSRIFAYASKIDRALNNAMIGAESYFNPDPDDLERRDDDDGFPGDEIVEVYESDLDWYKDQLYLKIPEPLPNFKIDTAIACATGEEVPWTGVWYPATGIEKHSLTFAVKGMRMQPVYRVVKTTEELATEEWMFPRPETVAVATIWHPLIPMAATSQEEPELWARAGEPCPKSGIWQPMDPDLPQRSYEVGDIMTNPGSAYGLTVWRWIGDR